MLVSCIAATVTAMVEFHGTDRKINRCSSTANALNEVVVWWDTLPQRDQASTVYIDQLVVATEQVMRREQDAWRSCSEATAVDFVGQGVGGKRSGGVEQQPQQQRQEGGIDGLVHSASAGASAGAGAGSGNV